MTGYGYGDEDIPEVDLAGCNTFDLTYNPEVAVRERERMTEKSQRYDDRDRYTNRADMYDTKPCKRYCRDTGTVQTDPGSIPGKLDETDTRERQDGPGGH